MSRLCLQILNLKLLLTVTLFLMPHCPVDGGSSPASRAFSLSSFQRKKSTGSGPGRENSLGSKSFFPQGSDLVGEGSLFFLKSQDLPGIVGRSGGGEAEHMIKTRTGHSLCDLGVIC